LESVTKNNIAGKLPESHFNRIHDAWGIKLRFREASAEVPQKQNKPKLLDQAKNEMRVKHYSRKTEESYTSKLPYALAIKHPNADKDFYWQYAFPAEKFIKDKESGLVY
jgi:hypothetical protein